MLLILEVKITILIKLIYFFGQNLVLLKAQEEILILGDQVEYSMKVVFYFLQ